MERGWRGRWTQGGWPWPRFWRVPRRLRRRSWGVTSPYPADAAALESIFEAAAQDAPDEPVALAGFAPRVCFFDRADLMPEHLRADAPTQEAALVALFETPTRVRLLAPDPRRLAWDGGEQGGAFCARAAYASRSTSGHVVLYRFEGVTSFDGAPAPGGAQAQAKDPAGPTGEGLHIRAE